MLDKPPPEPGSPTGMWKAAFVILLIGGGAAWGIDHFKVEIDKVAYRALISLTALAAGICLICATARFWLKR